MPGSVGHSVRFSWDTTETERAVIEVHNKSEKQPCVGEKDITVERLGVLPVRMIAEGRGEQEERILRFVVVGRR
jgi:hypothetical protein